MLAISLMRAVMEVAGLIICAFLVAALVCPAVIDDERHEWTLWTRRPRK